MLASATALVGEMRTGGPAKAIRGQSLGDQANQTKSGGLDLAKRLSRA